MVHMLERHRESDREGKRDMERVGEEGRERERDTCIYC